MKDASSNIGPVNMLLARCPAVYSRVMDEGCTININPEDASEEQPASLKRFLSIVMQPSVVLTSC